ncbi:putative toxin-antitoxin system toxin component, PIN family [Cyanobium sp. CH-040]|uniref:putative toxin-antitoxin system toxin component, PIN family n=1 Tax=Cyanobium sp. CH-040 TaxID=2823708 RepID=UPI0020CCA249|nr:putative toxin-antitoxin system toxin component, PIN family [Cyanobium sp. CH-040]MCP9927912.1 putative toxin-antitoxin system toxin component, PIN family [Cyanobium sp. CH-040]
MRRAPVRAVLDTNVLVSALLFDKGRLSWLRPCWQTGRITPVLAQPTAMELLRVLAYPKFRLEPIDRDRLLEDLLPWSESWSAPIPSSTQRVRDPHDQVFLDLALAAATPVLVSGDADLLALKESVVPLQIVNPADFQIWLGASL